MGVDAAGLKKYSFYCLVLMPLEIRVDAAIERCLDLDYLVYIPLEISVDAARGKFKINTVA